MVHDRLARVRELAHLGVAHLYTVERDADRAFLVWQWIEGTPLDELLQNPPQGRHALPALARDLVLNVESLHALGIVHGAIHPRNIIVTPAGGICLTHISPLLYTDPEVDLDALRPILQEMGCAPVLHNLPEGKPALRELAIRLVSFAKGEVTGLSRAAAVSVDEGRRSALALIAAALVAGVGLVVAIVFWWRAKNTLRARPGPGTPEGGLGP
jgi:aminoglycoside phosphotransferase (APT) family kinase protein